MAGIVPCFTQHEKDVFEYVFKPTLAVMIITVVLATVCQIYFKQSGRLEISRNAHFLSLVSYFMTLVLFIVFWIRVDNWCALDFISTQSRNWTTTFIAFFRYQAVFCLVFLYYRLWSALEPTPVALPKWANYVAIAYFLAFVILDGYLQAVRLNVEDREERARLSDPAQSMWMVGLFCGSVIFNGTFVHKFVKVLKNSGADAEEFVDVFAKLTLLATVSTVVVVISCLSFWLDGYLVEVNNATNDLFLFKIFMGLFDSFTNFLVIALSFRCFTAVYSVVCCCHRLCRPIWIRRMTQEQEIANVVNTNISVVTRDITVNATAVDAKPATTDTKTTTTTTTTETTAPTSTEEV